ncbi:hypothetical protein DRP04_14790 [Archaeoglobales archaeon]|nr:MAG: hypothetical protein DRP04_14790 [Archaeoglobales archaeon]
MGFENERSSGIDSFNSFFNFSLKLDREFYGFDLTLESKTLYQNALKVKHRSLQSLFPRPFILLVEIHFPTLHVKVRVQKWFVLILES